MQFVDVCNSYSGEDVCKIVREMDYHHVMKVVLKCVMRYCSPFVGRLTTF